MPSRGDAKKSVVNVDTIKRRAALLLLTANDRVIGLDSASTETA